MAGTQVCSAFGQTHDNAKLFISDGSQFTTGDAENPTLTIVTPATRQADYIAEQIKAGDIYDSLSEEVRTPGRLTGGPGPIHAQSRIISK